MSSNTKQDVYGNAEFSADAIARFPALSEDLAEDAGLLHVQMGTLAGAVRDALKQGDVELPVTICVFLGEVLARPQAHSEIENAVAISFVEAGEFRASRAGCTVLARMPDNVRTVLLDQEEIGGAQ